MSDSGLDDDGYGAYLPPDEFHGKRIKVTASLLEAVHVWNRMIIPGYHEVYIYIIYIEVLMRIILERFAFVSLFDS